MPLPESTRGTMEFDRWYDMPTIGPVHTYSTDLYTIDSNGNIKPFIDPLIKKMRDAMEILEEMGYQYNIEKEVWEEKNSLENI